MTAYTCAPTESRLSAIHPIQYASFSPAADPLPEAAAEYDQGHTD